jgi:hypothetical protein
MVAHFWINQEFGYVVRRGCKGRFLSIYLTHQIHIKCLGVRRFFIQFIETLSFAVAKLLTKFSCKLWLHRTNALAFEIPLLLAQYTTTAKLFIPFVTCFGVRKSFHFCCISIFYIRIITSFVTPNSSRFCDELLCYVFNCELFMF